MRVVLKHAADAGAGSGNRVQANATSVHGRKKLRNEANFSLTAATWLIGYHVDAHLLTNTHGFERTLQLATQ